MWEYVLKPYRVSHLLLVYKGYNQTMLDIAFIRENPEKVRAGAKNKNLNPEVVDRLLEADSRRRDLIGQVQTLRSERNQLNEKLKNERTPELLKHAGELKQKLQDLEPQLVQAENAFNELMLQVPNVPLDEVPVGKDESGNKVLRTWGEPNKFDFPAKDHIELGVKLDLFDIDRGSKVAGFRGYFLKNDAVKLQFALMQFTLDKFIRKGYTPLIPPVIDKRQAFVNTGHFPWGESEAYKLSNDETDPNNDYFLAGTAEVPLVSYYAGEILEEKDLPIRLVGYSPCYRREIGSYGKDTRGIYRVHEFVKVEQVVIGKHDLKDTIELHEQMLQYTQELAQDLKLPYRILLMCTGDMGEPQAKKYDLEIWMPGRGGYGEAASDSIMLDFQSRRANIRYRTKDGSLEYVYMLNNTAANSPRWLLAIMENYQQADGSIRVPEVLVPYVGKDLIKREV